MKTGEQFDDGGALGPAAGSATGREQAANPESVTSSTAQRIRAS
ncbi:MAG: hypothetical protein U0263_16025 [Polyangiaceae bacterium]